MIKNRKTYIILIFLTLLIFGSGGFYLIEGSDNWSIIDSIYMTVITLSTVGFGEVHELTQAWLLCSVLRDLLY